MSIQAAPAPLIAEGVERALDGLVEAGLDAIHLNSHTYYGGANERGLRKIPDAWAPDHRPAAMYPGNTSRSWVPHDPGCFRDLDLPHVYGAAGEPERDWFGEILRAARARGLKVHARYLDGWSDSRLQASAAWREVSCRGLDGTVLPIPCFAQDRVREWWRRTAADTVQRYGELSGLFYGIERGSIFSDLLLTHGQPAYCFCAACERRGREAGLDMAGVRSGFAELMELMARTRSGQPIRGGALTAALRVIFRRPELIVYEGLERAGLHAMQRIGFEAVKTASPDATFAAICHLETDLFKSIHEDWEAVARDADAIVLRIYHPINGARLAAAAGGATRGGILEGFPAQWRAELGYRLALPDAASVPSLRELGTDGFPLETIDAPMRQAVAQAAGKPVEAAVGVDISYPFPERRDTPPAMVREMVRRVRAGGARGVVLCREYPEISHASMRAAAEASRAFAGDAA